MSLKFVYWGLVDLGHDAFHVEFLGRTVPEGFYNASGSVISYVLMASHPYTYYVLRFAIFTAIYLFVFERNLDRIWIKNGFPGRVLLPLLVYITLSFFVGAGSIVNILLFFAILVLSYMPVKLRFKV